MLPHFLQLFGYFQSASEEHEEVAVGEEVSIFTVSKRRRVGEAAGACALRLLVKFSFSFNLSKIFYSFLILWTTKRVMEDWFVIFKPSDLFLICTSYLSQLVGNFLPLIVFICVYIFCQILYVTFTYRGKAETETVHFFLQEIKHVVIPCNVCVVSRHWTVTFHRLKKEPSLYGIVPCVIPDWF